jgi:hypothetical protein
MPTDRARVGLAAVGGVVYALGGSSIPQSANALAIVESYDIASGKWSSNHTPMPTARYDVGVGVINGILYVVGGGSPPNACYGRLDAYNPATNYWDSALPAMPTVRHTGAAVTVLDHVMYVVGGGSASGGQLGTLESFNPTTRNWTTALPPMPTARFSAGAAAIGGLVVVIGGCNCHDCVCVQNIVQAFDPKIGSWSASKFPNEPTQRIYSGMAASGPLAVVFGGMSADGSTMLKSADAFGFDVICQANWSAPDCTDCDGEHFGAACNQTVTCNHGVNASSGVNGSGHCSACVPRWAGQDCDDCDPAHFGAGCGRNVTCSHGKASSGINGTGHCASCHVGWVGQYCDACDSAHFGVDCRAVTCVHGNASGGMNGTGHCVGPCVDRWKGADCDACVANWDPGQHCDNCDMRHYGPTCSENCTGCERHGMACDPGVNGTCTRRPTPTQSPTPPLAHGHASVGAIVGGTAGAVVMLAMVAAAVARARQPTPSSTRAATSTRVIFDGRLGDEKLLVVDANEDVGKVTEADHTARVYE